MSRPGKSIKTDFAAWSSRVEELLRLIRGGKVSDAYGLAPSIFRFCFPMLARLFIDASAVPTEADFRDYQCRYRQWKASRPQKASRSVGASSGNGATGAPTALSSFKDCLRLKEKPPGMSDARWRMIQAYKANRRRYGSEGGV